MAKIKMRPNKGINPVRHAVARCSGYADRYTLRIGKCDKK